MKYPSISSILTLLVACYVIHTIWTLAGIFIPPSCSRGERCYSSYLSTNPEQNLVIYTSMKREPSYYSPSPADSANKVYTFMKFDYRHPATINLTLDIPRKVRQNGTMFMHVALVDNKSIYKSFDEMRSTELVHTLPLVVYLQPRAATFNLLDQGPKPTASKHENEVKVRPYSHIATEVPLSILTDDLTLPHTKIPGDLLYHMRFRNEKYLPLVQHNILKTRLSQYQPLNSSTADVNVTVRVAPISYGALRLVLNLKQAMEQLMGLGFSYKDVDDVKDIFADANLYLLSGTILIASVHLLFDFLAFKNDVSFWRGMRSFAGLSARTVLWRAVSQTIIFLYLLDEQTSMLVLIPAGINLLIEVWKVTKIMHVRVERSGWSLHIYRDKPNKVEESTAAADAEAMRYLSMLLYPLCAAGAVYSLIYEPQRSWYSWAIRSTVNGVYAFGFLFMLPQLFVNYRLRSVAALPWRAFMYKAFNTFIDDVFAFMITMPTAHRVACFRDDLVFLIYLYQRWLYPVDKTRTDTASSMDEAPETAPVATLSEKKND